MVNDGCWRGVPKIRVPQNDGFIVENPIKVDDLEAPLFLRKPPYNQTWQ